MMAALAESGRSKLDVEISYSSSNCPPGLSTADFANSSKHEQQPQQQHNSRPKPQERQAKACSDDRQPPAAWSTKVRSIPLSIDFDVSVFATQDRHGRLTLHPVLRTAEPAARQLPAVPAQSLALRGGAEGDLGRNNCAKASIMVHCPPFVERCHQKMQAPHQLSETDLSTASRATSSGAPGGTCALSTVVAAATAFAAPAEVAKAPQEDKRSGFSANGNNIGSCYSSLSYAPSPAKAELSFTSCRAAAASIARDQRGPPETRHRQRPQQLRCKRCDDCQSALPRFTAMSSQSEPADGSGRRRGLHRRQDRRLSARSLARVVRKLESLLDAVDPHQRLAAAHDDDNSRNDGAASVASESRVGRRSPRRQEPRSNLNVTDLRLEYGMLFRD